MLLEKHLDIKLMKKNPCNMCQATAALCKLKKWIHNLKTSDIMTGLLSVVFGIHITK